MPQTGTAAPQPFSGTAMAYDLRHEAWIPWRRRSGVVEWGPPAGLLSGVRGDDPVVGLAAPRPDFDGALQEFLIGLLSAALQPAAERAWAELWAEPPSADVLQAALDRLPDAFDLDGEGPRFFQDLTASDFDGLRPGSVDQLLIDTPGEQTTKLNKDLFVKRARAERVGRPAAAMALLTLQTYAPAGGQGHRTSLRGGGPLTTLVDPRVDARGMSRAWEQPLWRALWANVETQEQLRERSVAGAPRSPESAFPWLRPTRISDPKANGTSTSAADANPLEAYFGIPRRIRLEFGDAGRCDLTGARDEVTVTGFRMRNYGAQYADWQHPLTPHYRQKETTPWLPLHGQPGGIGWRDWAGLTLEAPAGALRRPAASVAAFYRRVPGGRRAAHLHVFGYDMDNMKARGWTEATVPLLIAESRERRALLRDTAAQLADATGIAAFALLGAVKAARYQDPAAAAGDIGQVRAELWDVTEDAFYGTMSMLAAAELDEDSAGEEADRRRVAFATVLRDRALDIFDRWCPTPGLAPEPLRRRVVARYGLSRTTAGYMKLGEQIYTALGVPLPGGGRAERTRGKPARMETTQ